MRQAVAGGTSSILGNLPVLAGAKSGTAQDPASVGGASDAWLSAVAPLDNPAIEVTSLVRSGGFGAETSGPVVDQAMQYFFAHAAQILATPPLASGQS
jgi:penicillin-binding protein 2